MSVFYAYYPPTNIVTATIVGPVTVTQGTSPWVVSGTVTANQGTNPWTVDGTVNAAQSGTWSVGRTWTLASGTDSVSSVQSGTWNIGTVTTLTSITNPVTVTQGTSPWVTSGTSTVSGTVSVSNFPTTVDTNYGTVGANTIRTAAQIGNATGAALFGAGTTTAQVLRVVLPTDQTAIPVAQSGTWTVQPGNTANTTPWLTKDSADGPVTPGTVAANSILAGGQFNTVAPTVANGQQVALQVDSAGNLKTTATATVTGTVTVTGNVASGAADSGNPVKTGGVYNSTAPTFTTGQRADTQVDSTGAMFVNRESQKATYSTAVQFTIAANSTDVLTITGSATKTIRCVKLSVSGTNTGNTNATVFLTRRSTANSGGTSTVATNVSADSTQAAATATVRSYTANPTLGTLVGNFRVDSLFLPTLASTNQNVEVTFLFGDVNNKSIVLRGTSESIAVNFAGALITGTTVLAIDVTWTEE